MVRGISTCHQTASQRRVPCGGQFVLFCYRFCAGFLVSLYPKGMVRSLVVFALLLLFLCPFLLYEGSLPQFPLRTFRCCFFLLQLGVLEAGREERSRGRLSSLCSVPPSPSCVLFSRGQSEGVLGSVYGVQTGQDTMGTIRKRIQIRSLEFRLVGFFSFFAPF